MLSLLACTNSNDEALPSQEVKNNTETESVITEENDTETEDAKIKEDEAENSEVNEKYELAYKNWLENYKNANPNMELKFFFVYLDGDNIPELIVADNDNTGVKFLSYKNDQVFEIVTGGNFCDAMYAFSDNGAGYICLYWIDDNDSHTDYYMFENGNITKEISFEDCFVIAEHDNIEDTAIFKINGDYVLAEEYYAKMDEWNNKYEWIVVGDN